MAIKSRMLLGGIVVLGISLAAASAYAGPESTGGMTHSAVVRFSDLHLQQASGVATLYKRITYAASQVCGPRSITGTFYAAPGYERCYATAVARAVAHVHSAPLTSYYQEQVERFGKRGIALASE